jgi:hypothetical protein
MKNILISSVAAGALLVGIAAANAQSQMDRPGEQPPAASSETTTPRAGERAQERERRGPAAQQEQRGRSGAAQRGGSQTTGQAQPETPAVQPDRESKSDRSEPRRQADQPRGQRHDPRAGRSQNERAQDRDRQRGQAERQGRQDRERAAEQDRDRSPSADRERVRTRTQAQDRDRQPSGERNGERRTGQRTRRGQISMSTEQRTQVTASFSERIEQRNIRPLRDVRFSVSVGARVPRNVRLYEVPQSIVRIHPGFRGHRFVLVRDEIVIIEPRSYEIVAVLPRTGGAQAQRSGRDTVGRADASIRLGADQRRVIRERVVQMQTCRQELRIDFSIGIPLPRAVEVCEFPAELIAEVPEIRSYRYVVRGDDVVIVDPDERRIVEVID